MSQIDARNVIIKRLEEDLIGPVFGENEILDKNPTFQYFSGKLYPIDIDFEEDEKDDPHSSWGGKTTDHDTLEDENKKTKKISSMGLSCLIAKKDNPIIDIAVEFGIYKEIDSDNDEKQTKNKKQWERFQFRKTLQLKIEEKIQNFSGKIETDIFNSLSNDLPEYFNEYLPQLFLKTKQVDGRRISCSVFLINRCLEKPILFQTRISLSSKTDIFQKISDSDNKLYTKNIPENFSIGHTTSTEEIYKDGYIQQINTTWVPKYFHPDINPDGHDTLKNISFDAEELINSSDEDLLQKFSKFTKLYKAWLEKENPTSPNETQKQRYHKITNIIERINDSIKFLKNNTQAIEAFRLANKAIALSSSFRDPNAKFKWRPFQIGFYLLSIESMLDKSSKNRKKVDLLWFPTGGGKTEAYLLLTATLIFFRRLKKGGLDKADSTAMFTRYTLRALTADQFNRLATMILCAEIIRKESLGVGRDNDENPFSIGLWIGKDGTPNTIEETRGANAFNERWTNIFTKCPCCGEKLKWDPKDWHLKHFESNENCIISNKIEKLPIHVIDEQIYNHPPSVVIGTVDKFVQVFRKPEKIRKIFSFGTNYDPPDLIIQDELHLISGPLGSITGAVEALIENYAENPKVIASTATIQDAAEQILGLYNREAEIFPLDFTNPDDSFFSVKKYDSPGRIYIGLTSATANSPNYLLQSTAAILMQSINDKRLNQLQDYIDPYTTPVFYFNSLREIGMADGLLKDDAIAAIGAYSVLRNEVVRDGIEYEELSSNASSQEITNIRARLEQKFLEQDHLSGLLATVMISVGLDVSRLGLMLIIGQPKTISEYIQASSRVGRGSIPGLVITLFNEFKPRDKAHFETFNSWNKDMYSFVESSGVTPFAARAREKIFPALLVGLSIKELNLYDKNDFSLDPNQVEIIKEKIIPMILERVKSIDNQVINESKKELENILDSWASRNRIPHLWKDGREMESLLISAEDALVSGIDRTYGAHAFSSPNSARSVESSVNIEARVFLTDPILSGNKRDGG